ncbi:MAG TPA: hypothetical protein VF941_05340, partial [Clostridia bacterium]
LAFLLPLWSQVITWLYKQINTMADFSIITIYIFIGILFLLFVVFVTKNTFNDIVDDIINFEANKLKAVARLLENILINSMKD